MPRFYCPAPLHTGDLLELPAGAARHVQVLRLQPGDSITLFNHGPHWETGSADSSPGGEFEATVTQMGRSHVQVQLGTHHAVEREAARAVHLAVVMPANERMDWLVEKATELGVASIQPLISERSVLRLAGERADKKVAHWQSVAVSAYPVFIRWRHWRSGCVVWPQAMPKKSLLSDSYCLCARVRALCADGLRAMEQHLPCFCPDRKAGSAPPKKRPLWPVALARCRWARGYCAPKQRRSPRWRCWLKGKPQVLDQAASC